MKLGRVLVQRCWTCKHQQVAHQVCDNKTKQARTRNGHDILSPQRSFENAPDEIHRLRDVSHKLIPSSNQLKSKVR